MEANQRMDCEDIGVLLKEMRSIDDKIIYQLNLATPTASFRSQTDPSDSCKTLHDQISSIYKQRNGFINKCLNEATSNLRAFKDQAASKRDDFKFQKTLKNQQSTVRQLQNEVAIEEILRERSTKVFEEKCRLYFKPHEYL